MFVEGYGIKIDRLIDTERDEEVSIQEYKNRENNKAIIEANKKILEYNKKLEEQNLHVVEQNEKVVKENSENAQKLEAKKKRIETEYVRKFDDLSDKSENLQLAMLREGGSLSIF